MDSTGRVLRGVTVVAFSGSRHPLPAAQVAAVAREFVALGLTRLHHGVCRNGVGAGGDRTWRGECDVMRGDVVHAEAGHLARNGVIAAAGEVLVAAPREEHGETLRSGTWWTVRAARRLGRPVAIVRPSGRVERERWPAPPRGGG